MQIYDTASRRKVEVGPGERGAVSIYNCGPTVYAPAHMGHAFNMLVFDVLRRYLIWRGFAVTYVCNYTDVDDQIIERARREGVDPGELAERHIAEWERDMGRLGILPPDVAPRATRHIPEMIALISQLIERGHAYPAGGDVYFAVDSHEAYGKLSGRNLDELRAGARVEPGEHKRSPSDFALWKAAKPGEPTWHSPWGPGRPGWHIECSAMSERFLGRPVDIHGGGRDLIFPHHENEKAQSEAAHADGVAFVRWWMHHGFVNLGGEKMSKSTGNFITLGELLDAHPAGALRLLALQTHYRHDIDFGPGPVEEAQAAWRRLVGARRRLVEAAGGAEAKPSERVATDAFVAAMDDDLNTAEALAAVFELVRTAHVALDAGIEPGQAAAYLEELDDLAGALGLPAGDDVQLADSIVPDLVELVLELRREARARKDYATSDSVRDRLRELGVVVDDKAEGSVWHREM